MNAPPTVVGALTRHARDRGDELAVLVRAGGQDIPVTWRQLLRHAAGYAERYKAEGVAAGDVVVICLEHGPTIHAAYLGAMLLRAIPSFVPFPTPKQDADRYWAEHRVLFDRIDARAVLTYEANAAALAGITPPTTRVLVDGDVAPADDMSELPDPDPDEVALLQHSSGTTGHKKGVMLTHRQIAAQVASYSAALGITGSDRIASWLPLYHDMGLISSFLMPIALGVPVVSLDAFEWADHPHLLLEAMDRERCTFTWLPNFAFNHIVRTTTSDAKYDLAHVRAFVNCSEPCKVETVDAFAAALYAHGVRPDQMQACYAMAETVFAVTQTPIGEPPSVRRLDATQLAAGRAVDAKDDADGSPQLSNGRPIDGIEVRIEPDDSAGPGAAIGELQVRGEFVFDGYYRNPEATAEAFADGWYRTGDLGCVLDGEVFVLGRKKDVIIHHGVNYYAHDIEAVASTVAGIKPGRCVAVAVFDPEIGSERIDVIAERDGDVSDADLRIALKRAIADRFQLTIGRVHVVEPGWLVKTTSGKLSRAENLAKIQSIAPDRDAEPNVETARPQAVGLDATVVQTIASTFDVPVAVLSRDTVAADVEGWDSLGHTVLMLRLGRALDVQVPESVAARARTVGELVDMLAAHLEQR